MPSEFIEFSAKDHHDDQSGSRLVGDRTIFSLIGDRPIFRLTVKDHAPGDTLDRWLAERPHVTEIHIRAERSAALPPETIVDLTERHQVTISVDDDPDGSTPSTAD